jgi:hypothetical protein
VAGDARHSVFRAAARLDADERDAFFYAFLGLANRVAVADDLPLGDAESAPAAMERAAELASAGLDFVARERAVAPVDVLRRAPLDQLFRVGANLRGQVPPRIGEEQESEPEVAPG